MITWWHYLLLVNLYLVLFFVFYKAFLWRETFFQLNRIYLVAGSLLSFIIPLIQSDWVRNLFITQHVHQTIYASVNPEYIYQIKPVESNPVTVGQVVAIIYIAGAVVLLAKLIYQLLLLKKLINSANPASAFSFFKKIRVNDALPDKQTIIEHEQVHTRQWHSADVLLIEAVMIINWFNPVVYFYRTAIKHVHEFIADRKAIQKGKDKTEYALLLLSQTFGATPHQLSNGFFNHSLLKQRIMMLNQNDSKRRALIKYGLSAPLFAAMLIFSSATVNNSKLVNTIHKKTERIMLMCAPDIKNALSIKTDTAITVKNVGDKHLNKPVTQMLTLQFKADEVKKDTVPKENHTAVFTAVEINPKFPGGEEAFYKFLNEHIRYPEKAKDEQFGGRVFVQFVVEKDGSLTGIKTVRDPGDGLAEEAERVISMSPKWMPGVQNGQPVRVQYTVPVNFAMLNYQTKADSLPKVIGVKINGRAAYFNKTSTSDTVKFNSNKKKEIIIVDVKPLIKRFILLDGKQISGDELNSIKPDYIKSISVIKGDSSKKYGEAAAQGMIIIKLKEGKSL